MKIEIQMPGGYYYTDEIYQTDRAKASALIQKNMPADQSNDLSRQTEELKIHFKELLDAEIAKIMNTAAPAQVQQTQQAAQVQQVSQAQQASPQITAGGRATLDQIFDAAAQKYGIEKQFLLAVAKQESDFDINSTSGAGAMGVMQLIQSTADELGVQDPYDPYQNIMGGAKYLRELLDRYNGNKELALAAYNAGWPAVDQYGGIPPYEETQNYVPLVMGYYNQGVTAPNDQTTYPVGSDYVPAQTAPAAATGTAAAASGAAQQPVQSQGITSQEAYKILVQGLNNAIERLANP